MEPCDQFRDGRSSEVHDKKVIDNNLRVCRKVRIRGHNLRQSITTGRAKVKQVEWAKSGPKGDSDDPLERLLPIIGAE